MRNFRFRLQAVLEQRERQEQAAKIGFAESESALQRGETLLLELREVREAILMELSSNQGEAMFDPMINRLYQDYLQTIAHSIKDQERYVQDLSSTREAYKLHLIRSAQGRQALVSVRERAHTAHRVKALQAEQKALDEISSSRHYYRSYQHTE